MKYLKQLLLLLTFTLVSACNSLIQDNQEYYEYRVYKISSFENRQKVLHFLKTAYVPALKRMGLNRIGVFTNAKDNTDYSVHMIIPFAGMGQYTGRSKYLESEPLFNERAAAFFAIPKKTPAYTRIDSSVFKAFSSIPFMELPEESINNSRRVFELRVYESHNDQKAALKRDMFNGAGETQLMRDLKMDPVFFGECLSGKNYPNLTYMLSASSLEENAAYWKTFVNSPGWKEMKKIEKYKGTVSNIEKIFLKPTDFSGI